MFYKWKDEERQQQALMLHLARVASTFLKGPFYNGIIQHICTYTFVFQ